MKGNLRISFFHISIIVNHMVDYWIFAIYSHFQMRKPSEEAIDQLFYALSDQNRRRMLLRLSKGSLTATELGEPLGITKQAVSKHLQVLEDAGLISKEKDGRIFHCQFQPEALDPVQKLVQQYRDFWNQQLGALEEFIENAKQKNREKDS